MVARALALSLVLVLATGTIVGGIFVLEIRRAFVRQLEWRADAIARVWASRAQLSLSTGDRPELARLAAEALLNKDVLYVVITGNNGSSVRVTQSGFPLEAVSAPATAGQPGQVEATHAVAAPGSGSSIGSVRIGLSLDGSRDAVFFATGRALLAASVCVAIILWIESLQLRVLFAPLRNLAEFASSIGQENLDRRANTTGADEVSALATAFNRMLDRLAATLVTKELAEQASLAKSRFLTTTSHELRTPLNAIIGYSEMLQEECADRELSDMAADLDKIHNSGQMLLDLVNDLLDYSKAEAGRMQFTFEPVCVAGVINEVAATVEPMARSNGNRLVIQPPPDALYVHADRSRFRQSLLNLASNACKFTDHGTVTITSAFSPDAGDGQCEIQVRDTGIGISPPDMEKLFEAFVQLDASQTRKYSGTGLGLAISRRFCRSMGGEIRVESQVGRGSAFTISLPSFAPAAQEPAGFAEATSEA